jgi:hypothetical protein
MFDKVAVYFNFDNFILFTFSLMPSIGYNYNYAKLTSAPFVDYMHGHVDSFRIPPFQDSQLIFLSKTLYNFLIV